MWIRFLRGLRKLECFSIEKIVPEMDHSLRLSIKWLKKWESQKEISYRFLAYLLFAVNRYPSLEKQTIRPALKVDSISGFSALFSPYRHPPLHRNNREEGLFSANFFWGEGRLYTDGYFTFNRSRWLFNEDVTAQDYKFLFFWTSIRTLTKEFNSGKIRQFFFLFDKWNYRDKKKNW